MLPGWRSCWFLDAVMLSVVNLNWGWHLGSLCWILVAQLELRWARRLRHVCKLPLHLLSWWPLRRLFLPRCLLTVEQWRCRRFSIMRGIINWASCARFLLCCHALLVRIRYLRSTDAIIGRAQRWLRLGCRGLILCIASRQGPLLDWIL